MGQTLDTLLLTTPELTRGNRKSQFYEFTGDLTSKVHSHYLSRSQWLQQPNPTARRIIWGRRSGRNLDCLGRGGQRGRVPRRKEQERERAAFRRRCRLFQGLRFRVQGSGFRVQGPGIGVQGPGIGVQGSGFRVQVSWQRRRLPRRKEQERERSAFRPRCRLRQELGLRVQGLGFRV
jgi:hypothetical protein